MALSRQSVFCRALPLDQERNHSLQKPAWSLATARDVERIRSAAQPAPPVVPPTTPTRRAPPVLAPGISSNRPVTPPGAVPTRVIGVDYGIRFTGLAFGERGHSTPIKLPASSTPDAPVGMGQLALAVVQLAMERGAEGIIVGLPVDVDVGLLTDPRTDSKFARRCRGFAHSLALISRSAGISVFLYDESMSTWAARRHLNLDAARGNARRQGSMVQLKQEQQLDSMSAVMLLAAFFGNPGRAVRVNVRGKGAQ